MKLVPHSDDAGDVGAHRGVVAPDERTLVRKVGLDVHDAGRAQRAEAAVHLGADAARAGALRAVGGPELGFGAGLGQVLGDGERVPHGQSVIDQHRHQPVSDSARRWCA